MATIASDYQPILGLRQTRRNRWAVPLGIVFTLAHLFSGLILAGWFYWFVPRFKFEYDQLGIQLPESVITVIQVSDLIVNYWYLFVVLAPVALILDFLVVQWTTRQIGVRFAVAYGVLISLLFFTNIGIFQYLLTTTKTQYLGV